MAATSCISRHRFAAEVPICRVKGSHLDGKISVFEGRGYEFVE